MMKKRLLSVLFLLIGMVAKAQQEIVFTPQWTAQAQFAGFYVAEARGYYREAGLNVRIQHPSASNSCINRLKEGKSQIITLHLTSAMKFINEDIPLINVMQTLQNNTQMIVSHTPLKSIQDLKGKKVGCWKAGFSELAYIMDKQLNVGIEWVPFISHVNLYISKAIDATMAQSYNEFFQLKLAGQQFNDNQLIYLADIGMNIPEDGVYVTADYYKKHRKDVDKFVEASKKGWEWAAQHPQETLDIVMKACKKYNINTNLPAQRWMLEQITKQLVNRKTGTRTYLLEPQALDLANRLMFDNGFIQKKISYQKITEP
jgi:NitT/TauT family transport system substrate-binding protein